MDDEASPVGAVDQRHGGHHLDRVGANGTNCGAQQLVVATADQGGRRHDPPLLPVEPVEHRLPHVVGGSCDSVRGGDCRDRRPSARLGDHCGIRVVGGGQPPSFVVIERQVVFCDLDDLAERLEASETAHRTPAGEHEVHSGRGAVDEAGDQSLAFDGGGDEVDVVDHDTDAHRRPPGELRREPVGCQRRLPLTTSDRLGETVEEVMWPPVMSGAAQHHLHALRCKAILLGRLREEDRLSESGPGNDGDHAALPAQRNSFREPRPGE